MKTYKLVVQDSSPTAQSVKAAQLEEGIVAVGLALTEQLKQVHIKVALGAISLVTRSQLAVYWNHKWLNPERTEMELSWGFSLPLEHTPILGRKIKKDLQKVPMELKKEFPWLKIYEDDKEV